MLVDEIVEELVFSSRAEAEHALLAEAEPFLQRKKEGLLFDLDRYRLIELIDLIKALDLSESTKLRVAVLQHETVFKRVIPDQGLMTAHRDVTHSYIIGDSASDVELLLDLKISDMDSLRQAVNVRLEHAVARAVGQRYGQHV
jgi:hypothetical protein